MLDSPLLSTKFFIPPARPDVLPRPRLLRRLDDTLNPSCRLALISAPAGFGKTTLVGAWYVKLTARGISMAWLTLSARENDTVLFLRYLIAALQKINPKIGQTTLSLLDLPQLPPVDTLLTGLINHLAEVPGDFILALEDYHTITEGSIHLALEFLLDNGPLNLHLLILTRQDPPLPLARLRASGQVVEFRAKDLRFTAEETAALLQDMAGLRLTSRQIATLEQRTEGWIAGLQMAALSMRSREDIDGFLSGFSGSTIFVFDYLAQEILSQQPQAIGDFLRQTSILERLCAPLCDALTGRQNSQAVIIQIEKSNLFISPLDEQRQWYRYHPLFADFLSSGLSRTEAASLHRKAAGWYEKNGYLSEAIHHALAAEETAEAARLITLATNTLFKNGELATLKKWLEILPDEMVRSSFELATYMGWVTMLNNQITEASAYADAAERKLTDDTPAISRGRLLGLRAYLAHGTGQQPEALHMANQALAYLDQDEPVFRTTLLTLLGQIQRQLGDAINAEKTFHEAVRVGKRLRHNIGVCVAQGNLAWIINLQGHLKRSIEYCQQAASQYRDENGTLSPLALFILIPGAGAYYDANDMDTAQSQLSLGFELCQQVGIQPIMVGGQGMQAMIYLSQGKYREALAAISQNRINAEENKLTWISLVTAADEAHIRIRMGDLSFARQWVEVTKSLAISPPDPNLDFIYFTHIRLAVAENKSTEILPLLEEMLDSAQKGGRLRMALTSRILQAIAFQQLNRQADALESLEHALRFAAPEGYLRAFLDEGTSAGDLVMLYKLNISAQPGHPLQMFIDQLLALFSAAPTPDLGNPPAPDLTAQSLKRLPEFTSQPPERKPFGPSKAANRLAEPLTPRELEVLRLMADGLSNAEIAHKLYLTLNTLKAHSNSIYGKLDVHSRMQAAIKARDLDLI